MMSNYRKALLIPIVIIIASITAISLPVLAADSRDSSGSADSLSLNRDLPDPGVLPPAALETGDQLVRTNRQKVIAVVQDGPSWYFDGLYQQTQKELEALAEGEFKPVFLNGNEFNAQWDVGQVDKVLAKALSDRRVDIVLTAGAMTTRAAINWPRPLPKPVVTGFVMAAQALGFQVDDKGFSTKKNLTGVYAPQRVPNDLKAMKRLFKFNRLHVLLDSKLMESWKTVDQDFSTFFQDAGLTDIKITPMNSSASDTLAKLGPDVELVYFTPPFQMTAEQQQALIDGFIDKKIKTYSMLGGMDVDRGILSGSLPNIKDRLARRVALNIQSIAMGDSPNSVPTDLEVIEQLTINARTAQKIGFWPDFEVALDLRYVDLDVDDRGHPISMCQAAVWAADQNIDLVIKREETRVALEQSNKAKSYFLPQIDGNVSYVQVDSDRADASQRSLPISRTTTGITISQMLFNDEVISRFRASGRSYDGAIFEEMALKLDLMADGAAKYLDYLSTRAMFRIEADNLNLIDKNLELARARVRVGISGREEVLRLETSLAQARSSLYQAKSNMEMARVALNQTLNAHQDVHWMPHDISTDDQDQVYLYISLEKYLKNIIGVEMLCRFLVKEALDNSPTLQALHKAIEAQTIICNYMKRKFFVPTVNAQFDVDHELDTQYGASSPMSPLVFTSRPKSADKNDWSLGVVLTLPLFNGGGRAYDLAQGRAELRGLVGKRDRTMQLLEQRVRNAIFKLSYSSPNITLTRLAAEKAKQNLEIVQDKYARGTAGLVDLLDAQNQALVQDQAAALAMYTFLKDYVEAQRAGCWFEFGRPRKDIDFWVCRFQEFIEQNRNQNPTGYPAYTPAMSNVQMVVE